MPVHAPRVIGSEENPQARAMYEWMRLRSPVSGKIPESIRAKELAFAATLPTKESLAAEALSKGAKTTDIMVYDWDRRGPYNLGGRTRALAVDVSDPYELTMLAGGVSGGMWRTENGGINWIKTTGTDALHSATCLVQDTRSGKTNTWYYGTGEWRGNSASGMGYASYRGDGIFKSTDGGVSWSLLPATSSGTPHSFDQMFDYVWNIVIDLSETTVDEVYAATYGGINRSIDGGISWTPVLGDYFNGAYFTDVAITSTGVVYATLSSDGTVKGIYRSPDGTNWTEITPSGWQSSYRRIVIGIAPSNEDIVYFLAETPGGGQNDHSLWKYTYLSGDGSGSGGNWDDRSANLPAEGSLTGDFNSQASYDLVVSVKPDDENTVFIGGISLYRSTDGFSTMGNTTHIGGYAAFNSYSMYQNHHCDLHVNVFSPSNPQIMYSGHDGGVSKTTNNLAETVIWTSLNRGYFTTQFYTVAIEHTTPNDNVIVGGMQDNGTYFINNTSGAVPWVGVFSGDGAYCAIADNKSSYYLSSQNGNTYRFLLDSNGSYSSFTKVTPTGALGFLFINPFVLDPKDTKMMYMAAGDRIWRNSDLTGIPLGSNNTTSENWTELTNSAVTGAIVSALGISTTPANRLYYGTSNGKVCRLDSADSGDPSPVDVWSGKDLPANAYVSCIAVNPADADRAMVVFSNYEVRSLFYTSDGGSNWTDVSGNLEDPNGTNGSGNGPSTRWAVIHPGEVMTMYFVGTSTGLYSTTSLNGTATAWMQEGASTIGNVVVDMIDNRLSDSLVVVATHGNGVFSSNVQHSSTGPYEPNDDITQAYGPLTNDTWYTAYIEDQEDLDWYYLTVNAQGKVSSIEPAVDLPATVIEAANRDIGKIAVKGTGIIGGNVEDEYCGIMTTSKQLSKTGKVSISQSGVDVIVDLYPPSGFDYDLRVYHSSGNLIGFSTNTSDADEQVYLNSLTPGTYYVRVNGYFSYSPSASYQLKAAWTSSSDNFNLKPYKQAGFSHPLVLTNDINSTTHMSAFSPGDSIWIKSSYINEGPSDVSSIFYNAVFIADTLWGYAYRTGMTAGDSSWVYGKIGILPVGTHEITFKVDYMNIVAETNETDNEYTQTITIVPPADIIVPDDYTTIQAAIDAAVSGSTIKVKAGTYNENLIMKKGVSLVGMATPEEVKIYGDGTSESIVVSMANNTLIEGFTITNGETGIYIPGLNTATIRKNIITGMNVNDWGYGITLGYAGDNILIKNNLIIGCFMGISSYESSPNLINNTLSGNEFGIWCQSHANPIIKNNISVNNNYYGILVASAEWGESNPIISYNDFWNNAMGNYGEVASAGIGDISANPMFAGPFAQYSISNLSNKVSSSDIMKQVEHYLLRNKLLNEAIINNDMNILNKFTGSLSESSIILVSSSQYYLSAGSPCIDAGDPAPQYNDPDGSRNDMGAFPTGQALFASFTVSPTSGTTDTTFSFDASTSTGTGLTYRWDFENDGAWDSPTSGYSASPTTTHQYTQTGTYIVKLEVKDSNDQTDTATDTITVDSPSNIPDWSVNPANFSNTMTMTAQLVIFEEASTDSNDIVGAFVGEECRGIEQPTYFPGNGTYVISLTIYSNTSGETVTFKAFDFSDNQIYDVDTTITFIPDANIGTALSPIILRAIVEKDISIPLNEGWTWFSMNISNDDMSLNNVLTILTPAEGDLIKNQTAFATYYNSTGWWGNLTEISCKEMYMIKLSSMDTLKFTGLECDITSIPLNEGWTWIGYLPQMVISISDALQSLTTSEGDLIKNQTAFAIYYNSTGWWGNINNMTPFDGYKIKLTSSDTLIYPETAGSVIMDLVKSIDNKEEIGIFPPSWSVIPASYSNTMTMTAQLNVNGEISTDIEDIVGVFVGEECRGAGQPIFFSGNETYVIPLTIYSNTSGETLTFKAWDNSASQIFNINETFVFQSDANEGTALQPFILTTTTTNIEQNLELPEEFMLHGNYPNPFNPGTTIRYALPKNAKVSIKVYDITGKLVNVLESGQKHAGEHAVRWDGLNNEGIRVASGIYLYRLEAVSPDGVVTTLTNKMTLIK